MAGIGFELRKLVATRTIRGIIGAAFSGTLVVAGPWLISAASLTAAQRLPILASQEAAAAFTGAMVWAFALSICLSAAPLYLFVRLSSDLIYEGRRGEAGTLLLKFALAMTLASLPVGFAAGLYLAGSLGLALAFAALFTAANALWVATMTATVVRKYGRILGSYVLGMALMYFLAKSSGDADAPAALVSLAAGYALTTVLLLISSIEAVGRAPYPRALRTIAGLAKEYRNLAIAGALYALATWADKAVLALMSGSAAAGTRFLVNPGYDTAFYYSNLALIPGLVFYTISTETDFALDLRRLITCLGRKRQPEIMAARSHIHRNAAHDLGKQTVFQGAFSLCLVLVMSGLDGSLGVETDTFARLLAGGLFQLVFLSCLNMLFYLELYRRAALSALLFVSLNIGLSILSGLSGRAQFQLGLPYFAASLVSSALAALLAFEGLAKFDRIMFLRASGEEFGK
jgi:uncharacterized membrane protein